MPRGRAWTRTEVDRLIHMREVKAMIWTAIARVLGRAGDPQGGAGTCCAAYRYHKAKRAREAELIAAGGTPLSRPRFRLPADEDRCLELPPAAAAQLAGPVARPRYFHGADSDLRARIARQGLTAGFLGDPPPGRSALDKRRRQS